MRRPFLAVALRQAAELRHLRDENTRLLVALALANHSTAHVSGQLQQALRDAELLALGWKDKRAALEFVRTRRDIEKQEEAS